MGWARIETTICEHDAEDRATLHANSIATIPARKEIKRGIEAVQERLRIADDDKLRLVLMRDVLLSVDADLREAGKPVSTEGEIEG